MSGDRHDEAEALYLAVRALPAAERVIRLEQADEVVRAEVERRLAAEAATAVGGRGASTADAWEGPRARPDRVGPYRILHELGRGGMGLVYLAVREGDQFKRRVAIKLMKRGMDTEDVLRRFELERQVLGALNHPGVARLYDAGETDEGVPYFVMENIEGQPLEDYCDLHRLTIHERLRLFRKVCSAVHYAHQNLVIHRDLKPSNILVTEEGQPKLLDFGIAKLINPDFAAIGGDPTAPELRVMTPEYASPEQVRGGPITTASDVYALGVLLYELVSGHAPYRIRSRARAEIERVICEEEPHRPSTAVSSVEEVDVTTDSTTSITPESVSKTRESRPDRLRRTLAGDIDNIVLMAMRKEPQRRYTSAEQLAEDLRRHENGLPVLARPDTLAYRATKFVSRNRAGVAAAAIIALLLVFSVVGTTWGWQAAVTGRAAAQDARDAEFAQRQIAEQNRSEAETHRDLAARHRADLLELLQAFMGDINREVAQLDGSIQARTILVETAYVQLQALAQWTVEDPTLERQLALAHDRFGDLRGGFRGPSLGDVASAEESYRTALEIRKRLSAQFPDERELRTELATSYLNVGDALRGTDATAALESYRQALAIREALLADDPRDVDARRAVAVTLASVGAMYGRAGDDEESLALFEEALAARERLVEMNPANSRWRRDLATARYYVAGALRRLGRPRDALSQYEQYLAVTRKRAEDNPKSVRATRDVAGAYGELGDTLLDLGDTDAALARYESSLETIRPLVEANPENASNRSLEAAAHERIGDALEARGDATGAIASARRAIEIAETLVAADEQSAPRKTDLARLQVALGRRLVTEGQRGEALRSLEAGRAFYAELYDQEPQMVELREGLVTALHELSKLMAGLDDGREAARLADLALAVANEPTPVLLRDAAAAHALKGDPARAIELATDALRRIQDTPDAEATGLRQTLEDDLTRYRQE